MVVVKTGRVTKTGQPIYRAETSSERATRQAGYRKGGGGVGGVTPPRLATQSQKVAKHTALTSINRLIERSSGAERTRLISERNTISNIQARDFDSATTSRVQSTISREQTKAAVAVKEELKAKELTQKEFVEARTLQRLREGTTLTTYTKYGEPPTAQTFGLEVLTPESREKLEEFKGEERKRKQEELFARQKRVKEGKPAEAKPFTTRQEFATSLYERQKEKGFVPEGRKIIAPSGLGTYAVIPTSAKFYPEYTPLKVEPKEKMSIWESGYEKYLKAEEKVSKKMPEWFPGLEKLRVEAKGERIRLKAKAEKFGLLGEQATGLEKLELQFYEKKAKTRLAALEYFRGHLEGWEEQPIKTLAWGAAFTALAPAGTLIKWGAGKLGITTLAKFVPPKVKKLTAISIAGGLTYFYGKGVKEQIQVSDRPYYTAGRISGTEIFPMVLGGGLGYKLAPKITGVLRTRGMERIPPETIVEPDVLAGKQMFPMGQHTNLAILSYH